MIKDIFMLNNEHNLFWFSIHFLRVYNIAAVPAILAKDLYLLSSCHCLLEKGNKKI